jgi:hypothetical protein
MGLQVTEKNIVLYLFAKVVDRYVWPLFCNLTSEIESILTGDEGETQTGFTTPTLVVMDVTTFNRSLNNDAKRVRGFHFHGHPERYIKACSISQKVPSYYRIGL